MSTVLWLQLVDAPPIPSYGATYQAGLYYLNGAAKPAARAFRFPFVTKRVNRGHVYAWGRAPAPAGWRSRSSGAALGGAAPAAGRDQPAVPGARSPSAEGSVPRAAREPNQPHLDPAGIGR